MGRSRRTPERAPARIRRRQPAPQTPRFFEDSRPSPPQRTQGNHADPHQRLSRGVSGDPEGSHTGIDTMRIGRRAEPPRGVSLARGMGSPAAGPRLTARMPASVASEFRRHSGYAYSRISRRAATLGTRRAWLVSIAPATSGAGVGAPAECQIRPAPWGAPTSRRGPAFTGAKTSPHVRSLLLGRG